MEFKKGDRVTWSSQANGGWKTKTGVITHVHKSLPGGVPLRYEVTVPPAPGSKAKSKIYTPRTSALKPAED